MQKSPSMIRVEALGDHVLAVGRMFYIRPYIGLFPGNRVYLHYGQDVDGGGKAMQCILPVFRATFDLLNWAKHYQAYLAQHAEGRNWVAAVLAFRESELTARGQFSKEEAVLIALKERKDTLYWIRNGKDKK